MIDYYGRLRRKEFSFIRLFNMARLPSYVEWKWIDISGDGIAYCVSLTGTLACSAPRYHGDLALAYFENRYWVVLQTSGAKHYANVYVPTINGIDFHLSEFNSNKLEYNLGNLKLDLAEKSDRIKFLKGEIEVLKKVLVKETIKHPNWMSSYEDYQQNFTDKRYEELLNSERKLKELQDMLCACHS